MDNTTLYVEQPHGFADPTKAGCLLKRPLEGTRQAAALFAKSNADWISGMGYTRSMTEPNIFWKTSEGTTVRVGIYVDNLLLARPDTIKGKAMVDEFLKKYKERFPIESPQTAPSQFMGIEIARDLAAQTMTLKQEKYIAQVCDKFLSATCSKSFSTPVQSSKTSDFMNLSTAKDDAERAVMRGKPYLSLMGALLWATITHPEVSYYVSFLCQFMHDPSVSAFEAGLAVLSYLGQARSLGITYNGNINKVVAFTDSSWGQVPMPYGGYAIFFCGAVVSFQARKLKISPQSSAEAETAVYAICAKDLRFVL